MKLGNKSKKKSEEDEGWEGWNEDRAEGMEEVRPWTEVEMMMIFCS